MLGGSYVRGFVINVIIMIGNQTNIWLANIFRAKSIMAQSLLFPQSCRFWVAPIDINRQFQTERRIRDSPQAVPSSINSFGQLRSLGGWFVQSYFPWFSSSCCPVEAQASQNLHLGAQRYRRWASTGHILRLLHGQDLTGSCWWGRGWWGHCYQQLPGLAG